MGPFQQYYITLCAIDTLKAQFPITLPAVWPAAVTPAPLSMAGRGIVV